MKSNLDAMFKTDKNLEKEGVWFEVADGVKFLIKRFGGANSEAVKKAMAKYYKPHAKMVERGIMPVHKEVEIMAKVFVDVCLIDWEGVEIDGEIVPFNKEKAVEFFCGLPELLDTLMEYAQGQESFKEDLGNS